MLRCLFFIWWAIIVVVTKTTPICPPKKKIKKTWAICECWNRDINANISVCVRLLMPIEKPMCDRGRYSWCQYCNWIMHVVRVGICKSPEIARCATQKFEPYSCWSWLFVLCVSALAFPERFSTHCPTPAPAICPCIEWLWKSIEQIEKIIAIFFVRLTSHLFHTSFYFFGWRNDCPTPRFNKIVVSLPGCRFERVEWERVECGSWNAFTVAK